MNELIIAAFKGRVAAVVALLGAMGNKDKSAVDLNAVDRHGYTALIYAARKGYEEIVIALLGATGTDGTAVDLNTADQYGCTALILAAYHGHPKIAVALLRATGKDGATVDVSLKDNQGHTAHSYARKQSTGIFPPALLARLDPSSRGTSIMALRALKCYASA